MKNLIFNEENLTRFFIMLAVVAVGYFVLHHDSPANTNNNTIHEANFEEITPIDESANNSTNTTNSYTKTK